MGCDGNVLGPLVLTGAVAGALLFPGFILNIPPVPESITHNTLSKRIFFTREVTIWSVIVHTIILALILWIFYKMILTNKGICHSEKNLEKSKEKYITDKYVGGASLLDRDYLGTSSSSLKRPVGTLSCTSERFL